jgi:hypothetical protein
VQIPDSYIDPDLEDGDDGLYGIWPENWHIVEAFLKCDTQWVVAGMGGVVGLNYSGVAVVLSLYNINDPEVFAGIQIMEKAALKVMNRERK